MRIAGAALFLLILFDIVLLSLSQQQCLAGGMKSVYVINIDRPDFYQVKQTIENSVLNTQLTAYLPKNKYIVCLAPDQLQQVQAMKISAELLPVEQRLAPGLADANGPAQGTELIVQLCDNDDRDIAAMLQSIGASLDSKQVTLEQVSAKRLKATIQDSTSPAQIARLLIDLLCEVVWIEKKSTAILL